MDAIEHAEVLGHLPARFDFGGDRLAEMIEGSADSPAVELADGFNGVGQILAGHESPVTLLKDWKRVRNF